MQVKNFGVLESIEVQDLETHGMFALFIVLPLTTGFSQYC
jgi:hypothetical protein